MLAALLLIPLAALLALAAPTATQQCSVTYSSTIKWKGIFFEFDEIFTTPIYTPTPIKNGIQPYLGPDAPKFFYRYWNFAPTIEGQISVTGNLGDRKCLEPGANPTNGAKVKMWDCYDSLPHQKWVVSDGMIRMTQYNLCLDVPNGNPNLNYLQVWECSYGNPNQQFTITTTARTNP